MLRVGEIIRTSYDTGPYVIIALDGPCTCPSYLDHINGHDHPSEPHWHITCKLHGVAEDRKDYWLNGYRPDGTCVWSRDHLIFEGPARGVTLDLFGAS